MKNIWPLDQIDSFKWPSSIRTEDKKQTFDQVEIGHKNNFGLKIKLLIL